MGLLGNIEPLEPRRLFATYFVTPSGDDNATGLTVDQAWRTVERVNVQRLRAGDVILRLDGKPLKVGAELDTLRSILEAVKPGEDVEIVIFRDGGKSTLKAKWDK